MPPGLVQYVCILLGPNEAGVILFFKRGQYYLKQEAKAGATAWVSGKMAADIHRWDLLYIKQGL